MGGFITDLVRDRRVAENVRPTHAAPPPPPPRPLPREPHRHAPGRAAHRFVRRPTPPRDPRRPRRPMQQRGWLTCRLSISRRQQQQHRRDDNEPLHGRACSEGGREEGSRRSEQRKLRRGSGGVGEDGERLPSSRTSSRVVPVVLLHAWWWPALAADGAALASGPGAPGVTPVRKVRPGGEGVGGGEGWESRSPSRPLFSQHMYQVEVRAAAVEQCHRALLLFAMQRAPSPPPPERGERRGRTEGTWAPSASIRGSQTTSGACPLRRGTSRRARQAQRFSGGKLPILERARPDGGIFR